MTERRPHWTDDLIDTVFRIMDDYAAEVWRREHDHGTPTFDIIAAVEDWQKRQDIGGDWGTVAWSVHMYQHYVTSEAAIARVRDVCERIRTDTKDLRPDSREALRAHERLAVAHLILRALDGTS